MTVAEYLNIAIAAGLTCREAMMTEISLVLDMLDAKEKARAEAKARKR